MKCKTDGALYRSGIAVWQKKKKKEEEEEEDGGGRWPRATFVGGGGLRYAGQVQDCAGVTVQVRHVSAF